MRVSKIVILLTGTATIAFLILIALYAVRIKHRRDNFSLVETGQSKETVVDSMGNASEIRTCDFPIYQDLTNILVIVLK